VDKTGNNLGLLFKRCFRGLNVVI